MGMTNNVGMIDRIARIAVGLAVLAIFFLLDEPNRWVGLIGLAPLVSGIVGRCPLYSLLGIDTCNALSTGRSR
jgi:hypothetical protein